MSVVILLVIGITLSVLSLLPISTGSKESSVIIDNSFKLSKNEIYRQGLGAFHGGEKITIDIQCPVNFEKNFSLITYNGTEYTNESSQEMQYIFNASPDYYEATFYTNSSDSNWINFKVIVEKPQTNLPLLWLNTPAKIVFLFSLSLAAIAITKAESSKPSDLKKGKLPMPLSQIDRRLLSIVIISFIFWILFLIVNSNSLGTFENWYTDHARHAYVSSLFLKDGFSIFTQPLGTLSNADNSQFMFVTWPEMPHLYPLGSIFLFLPFGVLLQNGINNILVYKLEIVVFLFFAHICLYFFTKWFFEKDMRRFWKLIGFYIIYVILILYAADGMFDSIAFLFSLFAIVFLIAERYDNFFLLVGISVFFKYQAGIFLMPLIVFGLLRIWGDKRFKLWSKKVICAGFLTAISGTTAYFSLPYLSRIRPEFIMNGINAFYPQAQISWNQQSFSVLFTLGATLCYATYMFNKNNLLSFSSILLLLPSFMLPYFQNWYLPFVFVYILIPQNRREIEATIIWLVFMVALLSFGGSSFDPFRILNNLQMAFRI
jgi:hypothetical protein